MEQCRHKGCIRPAAVQRTECNTCRSRRWIDNNPIIYVWHMLKKSAKKRGLKFTITKEWFVEFIKKTDYMENRGRLLSQLTIDRIENHKGYEPDNIQILTKSDNTLKYFHFDRENKKDPF